MIELDDQVTVAAPAAAVFDFLSRIENYPRWQPGIEAAEQTSPGPPGPGATFRLAFAGPGGRRVEAHGEVVAWRPGELLAIRTTSGPVRLAGQYELTPVAGGTTLRLRSQLEATGLLRFVEGMIREQAVRELPAALARLKQQVEQPPTA